MNMVQRFTTPILFPDGWRLILTESHLQATENPWLLVQLIGLLVPPLLCERDEPDYDQLPAPMLPPDGCVVMGSPRGRDDEE